MKQLLFMVALTLAGTVGVLTYSPFLGVAIYYLFAVLRPQYLWQWVLPQHVSWSYYVAIATIAGAAIMPVTILPAKVQGNRPELRLGVPHKVMIALCVWTAITTMTAFISSVSYPYFIEHLKIVVMFIAASLILRSRQQLWILMLIAAGSLGYIAYEVNFLYLVNGYLGIYHNGYGGLDNNGAGLMLAMGVPLCYFIWEGSDRPWRWIFLAFIPVLLHAVLMTYSRGAMVSLIAAAPVIYFRARRRVLVTLGAVALGAMLPLLAGQEIRARFFTLERYEVEHSAQSRFGSWNAAIEMAKDHPFLGFGPRNSNLYSLQYGADIQNRTVHSQYLQLAADTGFLGLALYVLLLFVVWKGVRRVRRWARRATGAEGREVHALACGVETAMIVFCTGALFLSLEIFELPYLLMLIGAKLGLLYGQTAEQRKPFAATVTSASGFWSAPPVPRRVGANVSA